MPTDSDLIRRDIVAVCQRLYQRGFISGPLSGEAPRACPTAVAGGGSRATGTTLVISQICCDGYEGVDA